MNMFVMFPYKIPMHIYAHTHTHEFYVATKTAAF